MSDAHVTVIIPASGREHLLAHALNSVMAQTYPLLQCIVIDTGLAQVKSLLQSFTAVEHVTSNDTHHVQQLNQALAIATGKYIAVLDASDLWYPDFLQQQIVQMEKEELLLTVGNYLEETNGAEPVNAFFSYAEFRQLKSANGWLQPSEAALRKLICSTHIPPISGFVFRRECLEEGWDERYPRRFHQQKLIRLTQHPIRTAFRSDKSWFRRLQPETHFQSNTSFIHDQKKDISELVNMLKVEKLKPGDRTELKKDLSLHHRLLANVYRKESAYLPMIYSIGQAILIRPGLLIPFLKKITSKMMYRK